MQAFGKSVELKINVENDEILLLGQTEEAAGKLLQGSLELNLSEPIKVKSINLSFIGKMKVSWSEGKLYYKIIEIIALINLGLTIGSSHYQHSHKQERIIINRDWEFVKPRLISRRSNNSRSKQPYKKSTILSAGQHKWNFELLLPGDLPQTLESSGGSVRYRLKAIIERSAFIQNTVKKRNIRVIRVLMPSEFELVQSVEIHNTWAEKMVYNISIPSKLYAFNDIIPISFKILPIASRIKVHAIMASIKEYCTYTANECRKTDRRIVCLKRCDNPFSEATTTKESPSTWERVLEVKVPFKSPVIFADTDNDMIHIRHRLKFFISLVNEDGHFSEMRCAVPIIIVESFSAAQELSNLPTYNEIWRSVPYDPQVIERLRTRASISDSGGNGPTSVMHSPQALVESRQPMLITGWSRLLSVTSSVNPINETDEEGRTIAGSMAVSDSNYGSRHHSRESSMDVNSDLLEEDTQLASGSRPLLWNGMNLGKVPSYRSTVTVNEASSSNATPLPPAYDSL